MAQIENYFVPNEAAQVLSTGIVHNPLLVGNVPATAEALAQKIKFAGSPKPSIPVNWRFAESISALKGLEAIWLNTLLETRYKASPVDIEINTDHASLFIMSPLLGDVVNEKGGPLEPQLPLMARIRDLFPMPGPDLGQGTPLRATAHNIWKTKDNRFFHTHGSMDSTPTLKALGIDPDLSITSSEAVDFIGEHVARFDADELDNLINEKYRQAGTICYTTDQFKATEHGKANANSGLYELTHVTNPTQKPTWGKQSEKGSPARPLAGLKVVDLTRVIAGPTISRGLAEWGASVMRVTGPGVNDITALHADLNWGKWNCVIDLKTETGKEQLRELIREADVVLDGYRPGVMERLGFGRDAVMKLVEGRDHGIIYARENCYGWHGPWQHRSGWQQISDAVCGVSFEYGRAMGREEAVTPIFPNSDYCTGVIGLCGIVNAVIERGMKGGSVFIDTSLNYYSQWLVKSVGTYPSAVWEDLWDRHDHLTFRHNDNMPKMLPLTMGSLFKNCAKDLFQPGFFEVRYSGAVDHYFKSVRPVLSFPNQDVTLGFNVGTRTNGKDAAHWPENLLSEVVV